MASACISWVVAKRHCMPVLSEDSPSTKIPLWGLRSITAVTGAPILREAFAYLDCRVRTMVDAGDHMLILAEVLAGAVQQPGEPMTYTRQSGFTY